MLAHSNSYLVVRVLLYDIEFMKKLCFSFFQAFYRHPHPIFIQSMYVGKDASIPVYSLSEFSWQFN